MYGEALKGHLDLMILVSLAPRPAHGYAIIADLQRRTGDVLVLPEGTLYPALHRLERAGFLASSWDMAGVRRRRVYELTAEGREQLALLREEWTAFARGIDNLMRGA